MARPDTSRTTWPRPGSAPHGPWVSTLGMSQQECWYCRNTPIALLYMWSTPHPVEHIPDLWGGTRWWWTTNGFWCSRHRFAERRDSDRAEPPHCLYCCFADGTLLPGNREQCSHTSGSPLVVQQWWMVDLGSEYLVNRVVVVNRQDCCGEFGSQ